MSYSDEFEFLYDVNIFDSLNGNEGELNYTKMALIAMDYGWYDVVSIFEKAKIEKERVMLEQRKKEMGFEK